MSEYYINLLILIARYNFIKFRKLLRALARGRYFRKTFSKQVLTSGTYLSILLAYGLSKSYKTFRVPSESEACWCTTSKQIASVDSAAAFPACLLV